MQEDLIPAHFDVQPWIDKANQLALYDDVAMAIKSLEMLPGYYRDNPPREILELKDKLLAKLSDPNTYAKCDWDHKIDPSVSSKMKWSLRGALILEDIGRINKAGHIPQIIDYGPGEYWLPLMLIHENVDFKYYPIYLHQESFEMARPLLAAKLTSTLNSDNPTVYVACEIIEHLWHEDDIKVNVLRLNVKPDIIHISTPKYSFDNIGPFEKWRTEDGLMRYYQRLFSLPIERRQKWHKRHWPKWELRSELGHLRTYTPNEFMKKLELMWPGYMQNFYNHKILHSRLVNTETKFDFIKSTQGVDLLAGVK